MSRERRLTLLLMIAILGFLSVAFWGRRGTMNTLTEFLYLLALAQLWNLLAGYAGLISVGQQAWIGLGAYGLLVLADDAGVPLLAAVFLTGGIAALLSIPTAWLLFRLRGGYFAIGTWVVAEVFRLIISSSTDWLGGGLGRSLDVNSHITNAGSRITIIYLLTVVISFGAVVLGQYLMRSKIGLGLTAIRDNEGAATGLGINTTRIKLFIFVLCAFGTGVVGGLIALNQINIIPKAMFTVNWTAIMIFIVVIGGIGTIEGPVLGTLIFFLIREYLSDFGEWSFIILGVCAVAMMYFAPQGVWGLLHDRFHWEIFPVRRLLPAYLFEQTAVTPDPHQLPQSD